MVTASERGIYKIKRCVYCFDKGKWIQRQSTNISRLPSPPPPLSLFPLFFSPLSTSARKYKHLSSFNPFLSIPPFFLPHFFGFLSSLPPLSPFPPPLPLPLFCSLLSLSHLLSFPSCLSRGYGNEVKNKNLIKDSRHC